MRGALIATMRLLVIMVVLAITPALASAHRLFALVNTGEIFASGDGGTSWSPLSVLPVPDAVGLIAGNTSAELTLATHAGVIYRSADGGVNWNAVGSVPVSDVADLLIRPDGAVLVLTTSGTLYVSTDSGSSFTALAALKESDYVSLGVDRHGQLYALTKTGGVEQSVDEGVSWAVKGVVTVSDAVEIRSLGPDLYILSGAGLIMKSTDDGANWTTVGSLSQVHMSGLTQDVNTLAAVTQEGELASSGDGASWTWKGSVNQVYVMALANDIPYVVGVPEEPVAARLKLAPPRPNPLWAGSRIVTLRFTLGAPDFVRASVYDVQGREVLARSPEWFGDSGVHAIQWNLGALPSGTYVIRLVSSSGLERAAKLSVLR